MKSLLNGLLAGYENYRSSIESIYPSLSNAMIQMNDPRRCLSTAGEVRRHRKNARSSIPKGPSGQLIVFGIDIYSSDIHEP